LEKKNLQNSISLTFTNRHPDDCRLVTEHLYIGQIFFHETINDQRYQKLLLEPFIKQLDDRELRKGPFQQDNATPHTARSTITFLEEFFPGRLIISARCARTV
jgi:hypothetical protein